MKPPGSFGSSGGREPVPLVGALDAVVAIDSAPPLPPTHTRIFGTARPSSAPLFRSKHQIISNVDHTHARAQLDECFRSSFFRSTRRRAMGGMQTLPLITSIKSTPSADSSISSWPNMARPCFPCQVGLDCAQACAWAVWTRILAGLVEHCHVLVSRLDDAANKKSHQHTHCRLIMRCKKKSSERGVRLARAIRARKPCNVPGASVRIHYCSTHLVAPGLRGAYWREA